MMNRLVRSGFGALVALTALAGCGTNAGSNESRAKAVVEVSETTGGVGAPKAAPTLPASDAADETDPGQAVDESLDSARVLAAAVVVATGGDVEQALLDDVFSLVELDAAVAALEMGNLDRYLD